MNAIREEMKQKELMKEAEKKRQGTSGAPHTPSVSCIDMHGTAMQRSSRMLRREQR